MRFPKIDRHDRRVAAVSVGVAGFIFAVAALAFVAIGGVDVAADKPHSLLTYKMLHFAFNRSVALRTSETLPPDDLASPHRVKLGAQQFHMVCSNCHGGPGIGQSPIALSMRPQPQSLPAVVGQFSDAELFWIVKHGVKFSAMPSWSNPSRDDEVWSMVAFVRQLPSMTAESYLDMVKPVAAPADAPRLAFDGPVTLKPADTRRSTYPDNEYLFAAPSIGFGDQELALNAIAVCGRCHGADGSGAATGGEASNLTLQSEDYLRRTLVAYAQGRRVSGFMQPIAAQLTQDQIDGLATYFAGLPQHKTDVPQAAASVVERGEKIAMEGIRTFAVPACAVCHESAASVKIGAPHIAGQSEVYLRRQLTAMRDGDRGATNAWNPMPAEAHYLTDSDIAAVAHYYASKEPSPRTGGTLPPPPPTLAAAAPARGQEIFGSICSTCHGKDGLGDDVGEAPNLTIHGTDYVAHSLLGYRAGTRQNTKMRLVAQDLDEKEMASVAAYVESLAGQKARAEVDPAAATRGAEIAKNGIANRGVPGCLGCHGGDVTAVLPLISRLDGQNVHYLRKRLDYFAAISPDDANALNPMPGIASLLTDNEKADVASYFAAQAPVAKNAPTD